MQKFKYAVTFEQPENYCPVTFRGKITTVLPEEALGKALKIARSQVKPKGRRWTSLVILLERDE